MKKLIYLTFLIIILNSCNQSVNKDLITGASSRGNGIGCDDVFIEVNGNIKKTNEFIYGDKVNFLFNNISGLKYVDGKVFPGLSMYIVKNKKDTLLSADDLFKNLKDGTDLSPLQLKAKLTARLPHKNNEKYQVLIKIWDKKGTGTFSYEMPFIVKEK